jgi:hypothetical protein
VKRTDWRKTNCSCGKPHLVQLKVELLDCGDLACWDRKLASCGWKRLNPRKKWAPFKAKGAA